MTSADATLPRPAATALPRKKIRWGEQLVHLVLFIAAAISVLTTVGIVLSLLLPALEFFGEVSPLDFFTGTTWAPLFLDAHFGVLPLVVGTLVISFWSALVAFPLGLGVAIYLSEYAAPRATAFLKPILEILAAIPTVVLGYFALTFVTPFLRNQLGVQVEIFNALAASLVLGIMLIPTAPGSAGEPGCRRSVVRPGGPLPAAAARPDRPRARAAPPASPAPWRARSPPCSRP